MFWFRVFLGCLILILYFVVIIPLFAFSATFIAWFVIFTVIQRPSKELMLGTFIILWVTFYVIFAVMHGTLIAIRRRNVAKNTHCASRSRGSQKGPLEKG